MADETELKQSSSLDVEVAGSDNSPAPVKKVELDLDDAPFLQAEEKAEPPANIDEKLDESDEAAQRAASRKKRLIIAGACAAAFLIIVAVAVWWFFIRTPPPLPPEGPKPDVVVVPSTPQATEQPEIVRAFDSFVVPIKDNNGQTRFLVCKFSSITKDPAVNQEMAQQMVPLRDAIYFYLRSKDHTFLLDARNGPEIKKDLLSVFNDYLTQGKLEDIVFESYLGK